MTPEVLAHRAELVAQKRRIEAAIKAIDDQFTAARLRRWAEVQARYEERQRRLERDRNPPCPSLPVGDREED